MNAPILLAIIGSLCLTGLVLVGRSKRRSSVDEYDEMTRNHRAHMKFIEEKQTEWARSKARERDGSQIES